MQIAELKGACFEATESEGEEKEPTGGFTSKGLDCGSHLHGGFIKIKWRLGQQNSFAPAANSKIR
jgi:hypothetical protein